MVRDIRTENSLFWPLARNNSYEAFFEQFSGIELRKNDATHRAASLCTLDRVQMSHPIIDLENNLAQVLAEMEVYGVYIDRGVLQDLEKELAQRITTIDNEVQHEIQKNNTTGSTDNTISTVNLASPLQVQKLLFEVMKIPPIKKTKTGYSVDEETLEIIAQEHDIAAKILEHRHASKLLGTYVR